MNYLTATTDYAKPKELPDTFGKGRVCADDGCGTILNQYHDSALCYLHEARHNAAVGRAIARVEGKRRSPSETRARDALIVKLAGQGMRTNELAQRFGLNASHIGQIKRNTQFKCGRCGDDPKPDCGTVGCPLHA